jgi:hypothetical protein
MQLINVNFLIEGLRRVSVFRMSWYDQTLFFVTSTTSHSSAFRSYKRPFFRNLISANLPMIVLCELKKRIDVVCRRSYSIKEEGVGQPCPLSVQCSSTCLRKCDALTIPGFSKQLFFCDLISARLLIAVMIALLAMFCEYVGLMLPKSSACCGLQWYVLNLFSLAMELE